MLFIDEVHRLGHTVEEILYPAMEDFSLDIVIGKGPGARSIRLKLPRFTVIGATTPAGLADGAAADPALVRSTGWTFTSPRRCKTSSGVEPTCWTHLSTKPASAKLLAGRGEPRGWPCGCYAECEISPRSAPTAPSPARSPRPLWKLLDIDTLGLDDIDRRVLHAIIEKFGGGPVGLDTIAAAISEEPDTIMDVHEPYLLQLGFLDRTPRGRIATSLAYEHLNLPQETSDEQGRLF